MRAPLRAAASKREPAASTLRWVTTAVVVCGAGAALAAPGDTELISVTHDTHEAAGASGIGPSNAGNVVVSGDGRYVVFVSSAPNLVPGPSSLFGDVYVRDRVAGKTERVSVARNGAMTNGDSTAPAISADGRFVAFYSEASNLVAGDTNGWEDIFVRDRRLGITERVNVSSRGNQANDGFEHGWPAMTPDARFVAFTSVASNLVPGDTNTHSDVFVRDRKLGVTERVSVSSAEAQGDGDCFDHASISDDGRFVAFGCFAENLVPGDTNDRIDVFVRDRMKGTTERVSLTRAGTQISGGGQSPSISADGHFVSFEGWAAVPTANLFTDIYVRDRLGEHTELVSVSSSGVAGNDWSGGSSISGDGRYVAFTSRSTNLVTGDTVSPYDVFVRDRIARTTTKVSVNSRGIPGKSSSFEARISRDGRLVAFDSFASNLVPNDYNRFQDVYLRKLGGGGSASGAYTVKPSGADFGSRALGTSTTFTFWLRNKDPSAALALQAIVVIGTDRDEFSVSHACGASVAPDTGCSIRVTFHPETVGSKFASVRVIAGDGSLRTRALAGTCVR
jgi:Tol biopolymer transport system component